MFVGDCGQMCFWSDMALALGEKPSKEEVPASTFAPGSLLCIQRLQRYMEGTWYMYFASLLWYSFNRPGFHPDPPHAHTLYIVQ